jgi:hypothetical protein
VEYLLMDDWEIDYWGGEKEKLRIEMNRGFR